MERLCEQRLPLDPKICDCCGAYKEDTTKRNVARERWLCELRLPFNPQNLRL